MFDSLFSGGSMLVVTFVKPGAWYIRIRTRARIIDLIREAFRRHNDGSSPRFATGYVVTTTRSQHAAVSCFDGMRMMTLILLGLTLLRSLR